ncbi:MAG: YCF48-related protein [Ignavibacteriaceae bacterium]
MVSKKLITFVILLIYISQVSSQAQSLSPSESRINQLIEKSKTSPDEVFTDASGKVWGQTSWGWLNPLPQGNTLNAIEFINPDTGWVCGDYGTILKTTNGGLSWNSQESGTRTSLWDITFTDQSTGWAVTYFAEDQMGKIIKTTNGGVTWNTQFRNPEGTITKIFFIDHNKGWAVGSSVVFKTSDGGNTWQKLNDTILTYLATCRDVYFSDPSNGVVIDNTFFEKTTDGGETWQWSELPSPVPYTNYRLEGVHCFDSNSWIIVGSTNLINGVVYKTSDGGITWTTQITKGALHKVSFFDSNNGVAVGVRTILKTTDSGITWFEISDTLFSLVLSGVSLVDSNNYLIAGGYGTVLKTTNGGIDWKRMSGGEYRVFHEIVFYDQNLGVMLSGGPSEIFATTNGGISWFSQFVDTFDNFNIASLKDISIQTDQNRIVVGYPGRILRSTDGGANWFLQTSGTEEGLRSVYFINNSKGFIVGDNGIFLKTSDGGINWITQTIGTTNYLNSINFAGNDTGWITGDYGTIFKTTNGGISWFSQQSGTPEHHLRNTDFIDNLTGWILAYENYDFNLILKTTNGGIEWIIQDMGEVTPISVEFISKDIGWMITELVNSWDSRILKTTDGGSSWHRQEIGTNNWLNSIRSISYGSSTILYACGEGEAVLVSALTPLNPKVWTWTGGQDSSWNNANNWNPVGVPLPGDSVIIGQSTRPPVIYEPQQQITIASLNILSGGKLTITEGLSKLQVLADVQISGTLEVRLPSATTIAVGGNWIVTPATFNDKGFIPGLSTVQFKGEGIFSRDFYKIEADTSSSISSVGNVNVQSQLITNYGNISLRNNDTLSIESRFAQSITGDDGIISKGTIKRMVEADTVNNYQFESRNTYVRFNSGSTFPDYMTMTNYPDTNSYNFGNIIRVIPSTIDTVKNIITAEAVDEFGVWAIGEPGDSGVAKPRVRRVYAGGSKSNKGLLNFRLSLRYEQSEVEQGFDETNFKLLLLTGITSSYEDEINNLPAEFALFQNYPNPFNPITVIRYSVPRSPSNSLSIIMLRVYDILGNEVAVLFSGRKEAGYHEIQWDASKLSSGIYFYQLTSAGFSLTKKMALIK